MKRIFFSMVMMTFFGINITSAQYDNYAALFGRQTFYGGTARYLAIGGAGTSLGGDLGSAGMNPAGLGMYRKSEFSFSPNYGASGSTTTFLGDSQRDHKSSFSLSNLGIALCNKKDDLDEADWRGGTFSFTMNRTNNFQNRISFYGVDKYSNNNQYNSMADHFAQLANGTYESDLSSQDPTNTSGTGITSLAGLAYWAYLIDPTPKGSGGNIYTDYLSNETIVKEATYTTKGRQYQWNAAYGANYKDKLYIGGGVGITSLKYEEDLSYTETIDSSVNAFSSFTFHDVNKITGTGLNVKLGYIYKVSDILKIGTTITSPTINWINQQYSSDINVSFPSTNVIGTPSLTTTATTTTGYFKFNYSSPVKIAAGMSLFAGKAGFISGDLEYVPYQLSQLSSNNSADNAFLRPYNNIINNSYTNVLNLRLGGELRMDIIRFRGGLAYLPNPYKYSDGVNRNVEQISAGIGVKLDDVYFDLGLVNTRYQSSYQPYALDPKKIPYPTNTGPTAVSKNSFVNAVITIGFYFE